MVHFCSCTKSSSYSLLRNLKHRQSLKSCKSCGGKLLVDGRTTQHVSMLSNEGLESGLNWKNAAIRKQRSVRRARTSFAVDTGKNSSTRSFKVSNDLTHKVSRNAGDMGVSESEKVGVSILGRRFGDTLGSVPIKKRRFRLYHSPSPPHSSSYSDDSDSAMERHSGSLQGANKIANQHSIHVDSGFGTVIGHERNLVFGKTDDVGANDRICDAADFSGISILAAAACDTNIAGELLSLDSSLLKVQPEELKQVSQADIKSDFSPNRKEEADTSENLVCRSDLPADVYPSAAFPCKESNAVESDMSCHLETSKSSPEDVSKTSRDVRFHWDLNAAADAWESHEVFDSDREASRVSTDAAGNDSLGVGRLDKKVKLEGDSQLVDNMDISGCVQKLVSGSETRTDENSGTSTDNLCADAVEVKPSISIHGDSLAADMCMTDAETEETKSLSSKDPSCFLFGSVVSPVGSVDFSICPGVLEEGKAKYAKPESHFVDSHVKVENAISPSCSEEKKCKNMVIRSVISSANGNMNSLYAVSSDNADKCIHEDAFEHDTAGLEKKIEHSTHYDDMDAIKTVPLSEVPACNILDTRPDDVEPHLALISQEACKGNADISASYPAQVASEDHLQSHHCPDASQGDAGQAPGMEKVEFLHDDDSQYEDGEFRVSFANGWLDDGEEVETEGVDYGSDRDADVCHATSDFSSVHRQANSVRHLDASHAKRYREGAQDAARFYLDSASLANGSDAVTVTRGTCLQGNLRLCEKARSEVNAVGNYRFSREADSARRPDHSASPRKISGWDRLPESCRSSKNGVSNTRFGFMNPDRNDSLLGPGDSVNRAVGPSVRREMPSRSEWGLPSDISCRNDKSYVRSSRSSDCNGFNPRVKSDGDDTRSIGRRGPPIHLQGRGRGDNWVDSTNHRGNSRHDPYYSAPGFSHHTSRNAAAAAVAKVESNGFVVAPDGTIVKARSVKPSSQSHPSLTERRSSIERERRPFVMHSGRGHSREMSPDRRPVFAGCAKPGGYGHGMDDACNRERRRLPIPNGVNGSSSLHHTRRDRSFSPPHRRPLHLSRSNSRSPSRSRTRSPHRWGSPRHRNDSGPGSRQRSRSPNFKPDFRLSRPRAGSSERNLSYASPRWTDGRRETPECYREYDYRRCPGRSSPMRDFARGGQRFDPMGSPRRMKPDGYGHQANSGRYQEVVGFGRGQRHDDFKGVNRRNQEDGYDMRRPIRHFDRDNNNMKRLRYDDENGFMDQNPRSKPCEFQRRASPKAFNGSSERQHPGDSPRRPKEERGLVRNGREVQDDGEKMDALKEPLLS